MGRGWKTSFIEKDLEVSIVPTIAPEAHISRITSVASACLTNLRVAFKNLNKEYFQVLCPTCVRPILRYATPVWQQHLRKHVKKVQKFATGLVLELRV